MRLYLYFLVVSLLISKPVIFLPWAKTYVKVVPLFFAFTLGLELLGLEVAERSGNNIQVYNYLTALQLLFLFYFLQQIVIDKKFRRVVWTGMIVYPILAIINIYFIQPGKFHSYTFSLGAALSIAGSIYYYFDLFRRPKTSRLLASPDFWIVTGFLFYFTCTFPIYSMLNFISGMPPRILRIYFPIYEFLNGLLYAMLTIAIIATYLQHKPRFEARRAVR